MSHTLKRSAVISAAYLIPYALLFAAAVVNWLGPLVGVKVLLLFNPIVYFAAFGASFGRLDYAVYGFIGGALASFLLAFVVSTFILTLSKVSRFAIHIAAVAYVFWAVYVLAFM